MNFLGCEHTLVLHADGTAECDGAHECACDEHVHELWATCDELGCTCDLEGEEHDLVLVWAAAA